jgi:hypothetical protein
LISRSSRGSRHRNSIGRVDAQRALKLIATGGIRYLLLENRAGTMALPAIMGALSLVGLDRYPEEQGELEPDAGGA